MTWVTTYLALIVAKLCPILFIMAFPIEKTICVQLPKDIKISGNTGMAFHLISYSFIFLLIKTTWFKK